MKKIIALALALMMALSMASVAFAAYDATDFKTANDGDTIDETNVNIERDPGEEIIIIGDDGWTADQKGDVKVTYNFTTSKYDFCGASMVESVAWEKQSTDCYYLVLTLKEALTLTDEKEIAGVVTLTDKETDEETHYLVACTVSNEVQYVDGVKKASDAEDEEITAYMQPNTVMHAEDGEGYVYFTDDYALEGIVKVEDDEKAQVYIIDEETTEENDEDLYDDIWAYLGDDYDDDAIVEWYNFCGTGFKNEVSFYYDAYAEDPHYFYQWDGEKFIDLNAKFDDDEDVEKYVFTADAKGVIIVTDVEIVAAEEETKNPDTGANDVVGVAAALAVVSLVAAGAVSLKK